MAYARMEFRGRNLIFALMLATRSLPGIMFLVPNFVTVYHLQLLNNYGLVITPGLAGAFGVFFMCQLRKRCPKNWK